MVVSKILQLQTGRQAGEQAGRQAGRQTDRQAYPASGFQVSTVAFQIKDEIARLSPNTDAVPLHGRQCIRVVDIQSGT